MTRRGAAGRLDSVLVSDLMERPDVAQAPVQLHCPSGVAAGSGVFGAPLPHHVGVRSHGIIIDPEVVVT